MVRDEIALRTKKTKPMTWSFLKFWNLQFLTNVLAEGACFSPLGFALIKV